MRRLVFALTALLLAAAPLQGQIALKIGYINSAEIVDKAPEAQDAQRQFEQEMQRIQGEIQQMETDFQAMLTAYQQQQGTMSTEARQAREQELGTQQQQYTQRANEMQQQLANRRAELVAPVMEKINQIIEEIRAEGNYSLIFDVAAGSIIAADESLDLTDEVLRRLGGTSSDAEPDER